MSTPRVQLNEVFAKKSGHPDWVDSLQRLVKLATGDTGGGRVAAKVILACYNSEDYPLDVADLGTLDHPFFEDAMNVIRLRVESRIEPHEFFADGSCLFEHIAANWHMRPEHFDPIV